MKKIPQRLLHDTINFLRIHTAGYLPKWTLWELCAAAEDPVTAISCDAFFDNNFIPVSRDVVLDQCARMKRRLQRSCRGLLQVEDNNPLEQSEVSVLHRTVNEYVIQDRTFDIISAQVDPRRIRNPHVSLMGMALRLLKLDQFYIPECLPLSNINCLPQSEDRDRIFLSGWPWRDSLEIFFIEARGADDSTGLFYKPFIEELDRVCSILNPKWYHKFYYQCYDDEAIWNTDIICIAVYFGLASYLREILETKGRASLQKTGRPVMYYLMDNGEFNPSIMDLLLSAGEDINERFQSRTVWSHGILEHSRWVKGSGIVGKMGDMIECMMRNGADPMLCVPREADVNGFWFEDSGESMLAYTTTLHIVLSSLWRWSDDGKEKIILMLDHCKDYGVTDSNGVDIVAWAHRLNTEMGTFIRNYIAAKTAQRTLSDGDNSMIQITGAMQRFR